MREIVRVLALVVMGAVLAGCASTGELPATPGDPFESFNRPVFAASMAADKAVVRPVAVFYNHAVPSPVRTGIHNAVSNIGLPVVFGNEVLQGKPVQALETAGRFVVNSTIGIGGFFDPATKHDLVEHDADFGQTLGVWDVPPRPYLVLPLLGPSNARDAGGALVDSLMSPLNWVAYSGVAATRISDTAAGIVDARARHVKDVDELEKSSLDPYATVRSVYGQHREYEIHGKTVPDLPNM